MHYKSLGIPIFKKLKRLYLFMSKMIMPVHHTKLVKNRTYYIKGPEVYTNKCIGYTEVHDLLFRYEFIGYTEDHDLLFRNVRTANSPLIRCVITRFYACYDIYYDAEEMHARVNAEKARQQMEERSLQMILKKVVNDDFKW